MTLHSIGDQARKRIQEALSRGLERTGSAVRRKPFAAAARKPGGFKPRSPR